MMKVKTIIGLFALLILTNCAHHRDVRPGVDGVHRVVIQTEGAESDKRNALGQAEHFCKEQGKYAAVVEEKQTYTGHVDEKTYNTAKTASTILKTVGSGAYVFGGRNEKNAGGVGVLAGSATDAALGNGYTVELKFKCM